MKNIILGCCLIFLGITGAIAQNSAHYEYVKVPEKFEFLKENNQYELNALAAFLFEKYGFQPIYNNQVPAGVQPCDILYANVHNESGLFKTQVYISLENCNKEVIFTSELGESREKDYQRAFHEALRDAFTHLDKQELVKPNFQEPAHRTATIALTAADNASKAKEPESETEVQPVVAAAKEEQVIKVQKTSEEKITATPENLIFSNAGTKYTLRKSTAGYELFKANEAEKFATLLQSGGGDNFLYSSKNISGNAFFDTSGDLVVEYVEPSAGQLISVRYVRQ